MSFPSLIKTQPQLSEEGSSNPFRNPHKVIEQVAILLAGFALIAIAAAFLPTRAHAFWPFSSNANAASNGIIPSSSTPALVAPTNANVNAGATLALATDDSALMGYGSPSGNIPDVIATPSADQISVYVVRPGDTLSQIAAMYGVSVNTIVWANDLKSTRDVHPGDTLIILPISGIEHTVAQGDTLKSLAKKYGADSTEIAQYNGLDASAPLAVGSSIIIPGGELTAPGVSSVAGNTARVKGGRAPAEPYLGGTGPLYASYYLSPVAGGILTQGLHGWNAVDIGAPRGTPIHAAAAGTVLIARDNGGWNGGYGNYVVLKHSNGTETLYAHMSAPAVHAGEIVSQGQTIGYVGMTGMTTGPHVHFEIRGAKNLFAATCRVGEAVSGYSCN